MITDCSVDFFFFFFFPRSKAVSALVHPAPAEIQETPENEQCCADGDFTHFGSAPLMDQTVVR